ncbi:MAG: winged helix-turn-helix transcriptional regulator [Muribaculaceae bacterium]|nr:winged helix-turn-helix transcriptional regulator [Muribaculaceae bacterium]
MSKIEITREHERIALFAKAISHPTRVAIMFFLADQKEDCYFGDIHNVLHIAKPTLSQHLNELKKAGLVINEIQSPKVKYSVNHSEWEEARLMFADLFKMCGCKKDHCTCNCCC